MWLLVSQVQYGIFPPIIQASEKKKKPENGIASVSCSFLEKIKKKKKEIKVHSQGNVLCQEYVFGASSSITGGFKRDFGQNTIFSVKNNRFSPGFCNFFLK